MRGTVTLARRSVMCTGAANPPEYRKVQIMRRTKNLAENNKSADQVSHGEFGYYLAMHQNIKILPILERAYIVL